MAAITPKPASGVITRFAPLTDTRTITAITPKPASGVITRFGPLSFRRRAYRHLGLVRGARGVS